MRLQTKGQKGVSLVELLLVVAAVAFLALLINNLPSALASINRSRHASLAREIAVKQVDYLRKQPYINLADGSSPFSDTGLSSLPQSAATFVIEPCPETVCPGQEEAKQITVEVSWKESTDDKKVQLVTLIGEGGLGQ